MVNRYYMGSNLYGEPEMEEDLDGEYVLYEDHAKALAMIAEMKEILFQAEEFIYIESLHRRSRLAIRRAEELLK